MNFVTKDQSDRNAAIERANGYREMMGHWAWKDFQNVLKEMRNRALEQAIISSTLENVQLNRGRVMQLNEIESEINQIIETL